MNTCYAFKIDYDFSVLFYAKALICPLFSRTPRTFKISYSIMTEQPPEFSKISPGFYNFNIFC